MDSDRSFSQKATELRDRTKSFAVRCLKLIESLARSMPAKVIANQLARSATSVGANYRATCRARSRREFIAKMSITLEEMDESRYWLELIVEMEFMAESRLDSLMKEADELTAIFTTSRATARRNQSNNPATQ